MTAPQLQTRVVTVLSWLQTKMKVICHYQVQLAMCSDWKSD